MNYIENVFVCLGAPILIAAFGAKGKARQLIIFLLVGMTVCLFSSYISTFFASVRSADLTEASISIAPTVEELMKLFPFLFYLMVFRPEKKAVSGCMLMLALGFATFENVYYLTLNGAGNLWYLLIRGFGTGAMHVTSGAILAFALALVWDKLWLRMIGTIGLVVVAITYHAIFNLLVSQTGAPALIGYMIPLLTGMVSLILRQTKFSQVK